MGCASSTPKAPKSAASAQAAEEVAKPPRADDELSDFPANMEKRRSAALFSRGESQFDDVEDSDLKGTPSYSSQGTSAIAQAVTRQGSTLLTVTETEVGPDGLEKTEQTISPYGSPASTPVAKKPNRPSLATVPSIAAEEENAVAPAEASTPEAGNAAAEPLEDEQTDEEKVDVPAVSRTPATPPAEGQAVATAFAVAAGADSAAGNNENVEERLTKVETVIYPSAKAALNAQGLKQYVAELEQRGIVDYRDLANLVEDPADPFWSKMPPIPDRKKFRNLIQEARAAFNLAPLETKSPAASPSTKETVDNEIETEVLRTPVKESTEVIAESQPVTEKEAMKVGENDEEPPAEGEVDAPAPPTPPRQKQEHPCNDYETDIYAADFGICVCGHPKKAHNQDGGGSGRTASFAMRQNSRGNVQTEVAKDGTVCSNYQVDVTAATFGTCTCGHPKSAHSTQNSGSVNRFKEMAKGSFKNTPQKGASNSNLTELPTPPKQPPPVPKPSSPATVPKPAPEEPKPLDTDESNEPQPNEASAEQIDESGSSKQLHATDTEENLL